MQVPTRTASGRVSTRAPARGATILATCIDNHLGVSTRAPARGATRRKTVFPCLFSRFNSRAREGRDTHGGEVAEGRVKGFNSRAREGRDVSSLSFPACSFGFNSRAREGRDP